MYHLSILLNILQISSIQNMKYLHILIYLQWWFGGGCMHACARGRGGCVHTDHPRQFCTRVCGGPPKPPNFQRAPYFLPENHRNSVFQTASDMHAPLHSMITNRKHPGPVILNSNSREFCWTKVSCSQVSYYKL